MLGVRGERVDRIRLAIENINKILSSLASEDALSIFNEAKNGITHPTETIKKLNLTQKRYYTRLKALMEVGLVEKVEEGYRLTFLGKIIYEILFRKIKTVLENRDRIALIDKLSRSTTLSPKEKEQIAAVLSERSKIVGYMDLIGIRPVKMVLTFDELKSELIRLIDIAEKEIYLATKYTHSGVAEKLLECLNRGIKMHVLDGDRRNLSKKVQILRLLFSNPRTIKLFCEVFHSPNWDIKYVDIPYSFIVVDGKYVGFELRKPESEDFFVGFVFYSEELSQKLIEVFKTLYSRAKEDPLKELADKIDARK